MNPKKEMQSSWSENMSSNKRKAIEELAQGKDFTNQLRDLLGKKRLGDQQGLAVVGQDLVTKILNSFANTLSILRNSRGGDYDEVSQNHKSSLELDGRKSEDSGESIKSSTQKHRRGCYKRRKFAEPSITETLSLIDDGHAWRKYGQKKILNAEHPRNYYRCTHKTDQGCPATKQVQQIADDPPKYRTTYYGHHACKNLLRAPQFILDSTDKLGSSSSTLLISFANGNSSSNEQDLISPSFPPPPAVKQESKESDMPTGDITHHNQSSSTSDYLDLSVDDHLTTAFGSSAPLTMLSAPDHHDPDVISGVDLGSVDFDIYGLEF